MFRTRRQLALQLNPAANIAACDEITLRITEQKGDQLSVAARSFRIAHCEPIQKRRLSTIGLTSFEILGDLSEIIGKFFLFDNEEPILIGLDQSKIMKSLHK